LNLCLQVSYLEAHRNQEVEMMKPQIIALMLLLVGILANAASCAQTFPVAKKPVVPHDKIIIVSPLTHSDWLLKGGIEWGPAGVKHMLDRCKEAGISKVFWRCFDAGMANYKSKYADPNGPPEKYNFYNPETEAERAMTGVSRERAAEIVTWLNGLDYAHFDSLDAAVKYGHEIGIQVWAWITINEDDHGWGSRSRFSIANQDSRWRKRDGTFYHSQQSFAYKKVRDYKLAIVTELVKNYQIDGVFLDWIRTGDIRDNPQTDAQGVADYGYEDIQAQGFKRQYGIDPHDIPNGDERWVKYRAQWSTEFMRSVRKMMKATNPELPLSVMVANPWGYRGNLNSINGNLKGMLLDVETWGKEGLVDSATPMGYYMNGGTPAMAYNDLRKEVGDKVDVWYYGWVPGDAESFDANFWSARKLGASTILFWEADYIDNPGHEAARARMGEKAFWPPHK